MSAVAAFPACVYSAVQDRSVSQSGEDLRESLRAAIAPPRQSRNQQILESVSAGLRKGRDGEGLLVSIEPFKRTIELLTVLPEAVPVPTVVVESENQIGLDWERGPRRVLSLTVGATPYIGYSALLGHEPLFGRTPFAGQVPQTVRFLLERIFEA